jgi:hypothetical protein
VEKESKASIMEPTGESNSFSWAWALHMSSRRREDIKVLFMVMIY